MSIAESANYVHECRHVTFSGPMRRGVIGGQEQRKWSLIVSCHKYKYYLLLGKQGKQCFQRWNRCVRFKVVRLSSSIPWDLRHAEQLLFLCPCSNLTVYRRLFFAHPLCASLSCLQYGISFGNKKPDNVDRYYIVLLSNLIEEGTVQCIVE